MGQGGDTAGPVRTTEGSARGAGNVWLTNFRVSLMIGPYSLCSGVTSHGPQDRSLCQLSKAGPAGPFAHAKPHGSVILLQAASLIVFMYKETSVI